MRPKRSVTPTEIRAVSEQLRPLVAEAAKKSAPSLTKEQANELLKRQSSPPRAAR
jgi:hypothetical protein